MHLLKLVLYSIAMIALLTGCTKENLDEVKTMEEEVSPEIVEVNPGQALISLRGGALVEDMRFDSAAIFSRVAEEGIDWFFNAEFSDTEGEAFFLEFASAEVAPGRYEVTKFDIIEFEEIGPDQSFAGTYEGDQLEMYITILSIDPDTGVTGSMQGSILTKNGSRELIGEFVEVQFHRG